MAHNLPPTTSKNNKVITFSPFWTNVLFLLPLYTITGIIFYLAIVTQYSPLEKFTGLRFVMLILFVPIIFKYIVQILIAPLYPINEYFKSRKRVKNYSPSVSVLIPARNEEVGIKETIQSVLDTNYPHLEIIVINDGSTDSTDKVVKDFIKEHKQKKTGQEIYYKMVPNGGKAKALNLALPLATNKIVITIDSDSVMDTNTIRNMVKHFNDKRVASVAGNVVIGNRTKPIGILQQLEYLYGFYFKRADSLMNSVYIVGGAAAAYRRKTIMDLGGFDESIITEDIELSTRLQDKGYHVRYAADALVFTEGPSDFEGLCNQRLRWKFGRLITFYKYKHLFFSLKKDHKIYLSFLILPIALFAEFLLFFEGILLTVFYVYTFYTNDYIPLVFVIIFLAVVIVLQIISDPYTRHHKNLLFVAPGAWILFYVMDVVEYQALIRSLRKLIKRQDPIWQSWVRKGISNNSAK
jgi:poly-beta-1,6-N-acetyl-D-glucosamine synthase